MLFVSHWQQTGNVGMPHKSHEPVTPENQQGKLLNHIHGEMAVMAVYECMSIDHQ